MSDSCPKCHTGKMEQHGPVCVQGSRRQSWMMCDSCGRIGNIQYYKCTNFKCDVHPGGGTI